MKRIVLILSLLTSALIAAGQNNSYAIDDECFVWFSQSENSVDDFNSDAFDEAQKNLLELSLRRKDTKAQTLYYVEQLKRTCHYGYYTRKQSQLNKEEWDAAYWNELVEQDRGTAQSIAKSTGYLQYYYYASDLCQTYYFNTGQDVIAGDMLIAMMQEARINNDEYGMWRSLIYLSLLYKRYGDMRNTQLYLLDAMHIYETSSDPTITRQGMATQYLDLACTYPVGSDSARINFSKAEQSILTRQDSIKVYYFKAQLSAWDGDHAEYRRYKDYCLSMPSFPALIINGPYVFNCIDNILRDSRTEAFRSSIDSLYFHQQSIFVSQLAAKHGQWETASRALFAYTERLAYDIYNINRQRLGQMSAEYENNRLRDDLAQASQKVTRTTIWIAVLLTIILLGALFIALRHVRSLKKAFYKEEARIAELQHENNELKE